MKSALPVGTKLTVTRLYKNNQNKYWYEAEISSGTYAGKKGYVFAGETKVTEYKRSITYSGKTFPTSLNVGNTYDVDWTIISQKLNISTINGYIYGGSNLNEVKYQGTLTNVNATSKALGGTSLDNALYFNLLPAGRYKLVITAVTPNNYSSDGNSMSTNSPVVTAISFEFSESDGSTPVENKYYLDLNAYIDGVARGNFSGVGDADVYIYDSNGQLKEKKENVSDYCEAWPTGTRYEIDDIRGFGYGFSGFYGGGLVGTIGNADVEVKLSFTTTPESSTAAKSVTYNGHQYERYDYHLSWTEAKAFCDNMGGHLVTITSAQEQAEIENLLNGCPFGTYFLGGFDLNQSGNWSWVTGEPFTYANWDPEYEPSRGQGEYYCQIMAKENPPDKQIGEWNDVENDGGGGFYSRKNSGFICEYESLEEYTISYDANGGNTNNLPENQTKRERESITLSSKKPNYPEHRFMGWALSPDATEAVYQPGDLFDIDADTTLYAVWAHIWIIALDGNGGEGLPAILVVDGETAIIPEEIPENHGFPFLGWSTNRAATTGEYQPGDSITVHQDTRLFAIWRRAYFSEWYNRRPAGVNKELIETRIQYRYATKETTTSTNSSLDGWTQVGTTTAWSDYGPWSGWSSNYVSPSNSTQVETRTAYGWYYYICPNCGNHWHGYGFTCFSSWGGGCGQATVTNNFCAEYLPVDWNQAQDWHGTGAYYANIDGVRWFKWGDGGTQTQYRYRTRSQVTTYTYERWTDWSDWSNTMITGNDYRKVETRYTYRCVVDEDRIMMLPSGLKTIESEAFKGMAGDAVIVPPGVTSIADDAFDAGVVIIGSSNSEAEDYADRNGQVFIPNDDQNG